MSLALATKGILYTIIPSTGYPIYLSVEDPDLKTEEIGSLDVRVKELKPIIKIEVREDQ